MYLLHEQTILRNCQLNMYCVEYVLVGLQRYSNSHFLVSRNRTMLFDSSTNIDLRQTLSIVERLRIKQADDNQLQKLKRRTHYRLHANEFSIFHARYTLTQFTSPSLAVATPKSISGPKKSTFNANTFKNTSSGFRASVLFHMRYDLWHTVEKSRFKK